jgi:hypothetical protein
MEGSGLPRATYQHLRKLFSHKLNLDTEYLMYRRMEILSGVKPVFYDMCTNLCCLFVGPFADHQNCAICGGPRFHINTKPIARFSYLPIIPRFQAWYGSVAMIERLNYRSQHRHNINEIHDVFDGSNYQQLLHSHVVLDGTQLPHRYFSDARDIAFGGSTDGFQVTIDLFTH